jgi:hypothetical protein
MDEKMVALAGAVAGATVAGRGLRPLAKVVLRGAMAAADATNSARKELVELYREARAEHRGSEPPPASASEPA